MSTVVQLITPIITRGVRTLGDVELLERSDLKIHHSLLDSGPSSIESEFDEALSIPDTIRKAILAEQAGANAIVIDCMGDPGLHACREVVSIPVLGAGQTSLHMANMLGHRFSFITVLGRIRPMIDKIIHSYGLAQQYASFQSIDVPVLELSHDLDALNAALAEKARLSIEQDGADAIVLGCTGFLGCAEAIRAAMLATDYDVPVIDPIPATIQVADAMVKCGLSHSKIECPYPSVKPVAGFNLPKFGKTAASQK